MNSISSGVTATQMFSRADTNSSGGIELDEFVAGKPGHVSEEEAAAKFTELDTEGTGSLSQEQMAQGDPRRSSAQLSDESMSALLELTQQNSSGSEIFNSLDADESGTLSQDEFISGRPGFASESDAATEFARLDADGDGSLTSEEVEAGQTESSSEVAGNRPPPPPPPGGGEVSLDEIFDDLDLNEDGVVDVSELMSALEEDGTESQISNALSALFERASAAYNADFGVENVTDSAVA